jgi:outer membrane protein assembly factor BamD
VNRWLFCLLCAAGIFAGARRCPAPLIYRPGEGWTYEAVGETGKWQRNRAKEQLQVAQEAFDQKKYRLALKAARRTVKVWPLSDYAGPAQYLIGRCYEARRMDDKAFKQYQIALIRYPKLPNYPEVLRRQLDIGRRYLGGQWFKLWGYVPFFPSMDKTAMMFDQIARNGPYHPTGPVAQMDVGTTREKQKNYPLAVRAYEKAADKYFDRPEIAADAMYRAGLAWNKQARRAEYDQSASVNSIDMLNDFKALYPNDKRGPDATGVILELKTEQARGAFETGKFYERYRKYQGALVYYNEVLIKDPKSPFAERARERIEVLKPYAAQQARQVEERDARIREALRKASGTGITEPSDKTGK